MFSLSCADMSGRHIRATFSTSHHFVATTRPPPTGARTCKRMLPAQANKDDGGLGDDLLDFMLVVKLPVDCSFRGSCCRLQHQSQARSCAFLHPHHIVPVSTRRYAGRKLRRWYGAEGKVLPKDERPAEQQRQQPDEPEEEPAGPREAVVVLDADTCPMAEQALLQLILLQRGGNVRAVVRDATAAKAAFGPYVQVETELRSALRGAMAAIVCGPLTTDLLAASAATRLPHLVLLSTVGAPRPPGPLLPFSAAAAETATLGDMSREERLKAAAPSLRHTIVQVGALSNCPGGMSRLQLGSGGRPGGKISREDAARVLAEAASWQGGASLVLQVAAAGPGASPVDWPAAFDSLLPTAATA